MKTYDKFIDFFTSECEVVCDSNGFYFYKEPLIIAVKNSDLEPEYLDEMIRGVNINHTHSVDYAVHYLYELKMNRGYPTDKHIALYRAFQIIAELFDVKTDISISVSEKTLRQRVSDKGITYSIFSDF